MDFNEKIREISSRSKNAEQHALTEEATKTSVVMPLIQALGFDVFSLSEVVPEFIADVGIKKGEKVDFAIKVDGKVAILIETKPISTNLGKNHHSQIYRYFGASTARIAILTNGREVWFFSDIDDANRMDAHPFFTFDLQSFDENQVKTLSQFQKGKFDIDQILEAASGLKYTKSASSYLLSQMTDPSDDFVKFVGKNIHPGPVTKNVMDQLRPALKSAFDAIVRTIIQEKLSVTFRPIEPQPQPEKSDSPDLFGTEATEEEVQGFYIVRAIASKIVKTDKITIRDAKSYCGVLFDDNNRKPICRLHFNGKVKCIGVFSPDRVETKYKIDDLSDIHKYAEEILDVTKHYLGEV